MERTEELKATARAAGADLVGVADLTPFRANGTLLRPNTLEGFSNAVSVAARLDDEIVDGIQWAPTPEYAQHYGVVNAALNRITAQLAKWVRSRGFAAYAIPASEIVDETDLLGSISHKAVARLAGIGWQGRAS